MKFNRSVVLGTALSLIMSVLFFSTAFAWTVSTYECTSPGTSGGVTVPNADWVSDYKLYVFTDGQQVGVVSRGESLDLPAGNYVGKWSRDGGQSFLEEKENFSIEKDCPDKKVTICHALPDSASHLYNQLTVSIASSGYVQGGHHVPGGEIGDKHEDGGDIIPPYTYVEFEYPGQNWTQEGQVIWNNNCVIPPKPPEPELDVDVSCVNGDSGVLDTVKVVSSYKTFDREMTLSHNLTIDTEQMGTKSINTQLGVEGVGDVVSKVLAGRGTHRVYGSVALGSITENVDQKVKCADVIKPPDPPKPEVYAPSASIFVCGDPRVTATLDNSKSTMMVRYKMIFKHGLTGERIVKWKFVKAGTVIVTKPIWVKGNGNFFRIRGQYLEPLVVERIYSTDRCNMAN